MEKSQASKESIKHTNYEDNKKKPRHPHDEET